MSDVPRLETPRIDPSAFVADTATIHGRVGIGERAVVLFNVVIRAEFDSIEIGAETNVQDGVIVHCDAGVPTWVGRRTTIGHAAVIHGAFVGDHCLVGIGSLALNGARLEEGAWLAAGSVLTEGTTIPPWTLAVGTPARPVRDLRPAEIERQASGVESYLTLGEAYRTA